MNKPESTQTKPEAGQTLAPTACYAPDPDAIELIIGERRKQFVKWGEQNHDMMTWLAILHEETGELSEACLHNKFGGPEAGNVMKEAIQVAAVGLQIVEYLGRKYQETYDAAQVHNS